MTSLRSTCVCLASLLLAACGDAPGDDPPGMTGDGAADATGSSDTGAPTTGDEASSGETGGASEASGSVSESSGDESGESSSDESSGDESSGESSGGPDDEGPAGQCGGRDGAVKGETGGVEARLLTAPGVLWTGTFECPGWEAEWGALDWHSGSKPQQTIVDGAAVDAGKAMQVTMTEEGASEGWYKGMNLHAGLTGLGLAGDHQDIYLRYYLRLPEGFDFGDSGKLPGLAGKQGGGTTDWAGGGEHFPDSWSVRMLYVGKANPSPPAGKGFLKAYVYADNQKNDKGHGVGHTLYADLDAKTPLVLETGRSYAIELHVRVNPVPGEVAGSVLEVWIDGHKALSLVDKVMFQPAEFEIPVTGLWWTAFSGGVVHPNQHLFLDSPVLSTSYIGPRE
jgi:hypothetical protein